MMKGNLFNVEIFDLKDEVIDGTPSDFSLKSLNTADEYSLRTHTHILHHVPLIPQDLPLIYIPPKYNNGQILTYSSDPAPSCPLIG